MLKANTETDTVDQSVTMELKIELTPASDIELLLKKITRIANVFNVFQLSEPSL
ncbi:MAG: hypothetical protein QM479_04290 [Pseudomonadota bacterium]